MDEPFPPFSAGGHLVDRWVERWMDAWTDEPSVHAQTDGWTRWTGVETSKIKVWWDEPMDGRTDGLMDAYTMAG